MEYQYVGRRSGALTLVSVAAFFCCVLVLFGEMMSELAELRWGTYVPLGGSSRFSLPFFSSLVLSVACAGAAAVWAVFPGTSYRFALTGPAIGLAFLSALFVFIPTCVANVRLVSLPPISATLLGAITPIPAAFFARLMIGNDGRRWGNAATCSAVVITSVAFVVQFVDPVLTDASSTPFTALGAGWSVYYFFAVVLGTAAHYATNSAFMAKFARPSGALESTYVGVSPEMLEVAMDDPTRYRPVSASIVFLLLTSVFSTGLFALGPLYDAIPRVGTPASGLTSDASISVGKAYSRFANGFTQCIFRDRDAYNCGNWHTFIGVGVGCRIAVTVGVAIGAQFGPLCPMISLFAASTLRRLAMALWPDWSPVFQLYMSAGEVAEAVIALVLFGIGFVVWMVWDIRSRREVARNEGDAVNFTLDRAAYHPGYHSGPHTYQPVTLTEGFAPNKAEA